MELDGFLNSCVFIDLELHADRRLGRLGAFCGQAVFERGGRPAVRAALDELDRFATDAGARWLVGHNVLRHDWPAIRRIAPDLALLRLPVVDTLLLSPLAFPENPYHALVKDYKLVKDSVNDPVADSRQAARLLRDQWQAFADLAAHGEPDVLNWYRSCLQDDAPLPDGAKHTDGLTKELPDCNKPAAER